MKTFEELHPDITKLDSYATLKHWEYRDIRDNIQEAWDRKEDGTWVNTTLLHQAIQKAEREEARLTRMEAKNAESTN
jgi:hypothetical protein